MTLYAVIDQQLKTMVELRKQLEAKLVVSREAHEEERKILFANAIAFNGYCYNCTHGAAPLDFLVSIFQQLAQHNLTEARVKEFREHEADLCIVELEIGYVRAIEEKLALLFQNLHDGKCSEVLLECLQIPKTLKEGK